MKIDFSRARYAVPWYIDEWKEFSSNPIEESDYTLGQLLAALPIVSSKSAISKMNSVIAQDARQRGFKVIAPFRAGKSSQSLKEQANLSEGADRAIASPTQQIMRPALELSWMPPAMARSKLYSSLKHEEVLSISNATEWLDYLLDLYRIVRMAAVELEREQDDKSSQLKFFESQLELQRMIHSQGERLSQVHTHIQQSASSSAEKKARTSPGTYRYPDAFNYGYELFKNNPEITPPNLFRKLESYQRQQQAKGIDFELPISRDTPSNWVKKYKKRFEAERELK